MPAPVELPGQESLQMYFDWVQLHRQTMTAAVDKEVSDWRCGKTPQPAAANASVSSSASATKKTLPKQSKGESSSDSGLTAGGCAKRSPPNSYDTLPTQFECRQFLCHLEDSASQLEAAIAAPGDCSAGDLKKKQQYQQAQPPQLPPPRAVLDRLSLLEALAELHEADDLTRRLYSLHASYACRTRRGRDFWLVNCRHLLHLAWRGRVDELATLRASLEPFRAQCAPGVGAYEPSTQTDDAVSGKTSASSNTWYPEELILADLAEAICTASVEGGTPKRFADACARLRLIVRRHRDDFAGKTRDLMLARAMLLLWQVRCRLLAGPELDGDEVAVWGEDPADTAVGDPGGADPMEQLLYLRKLTVSLVLHHFREKTPCQLPVKSADPFARDAWLSVHLLLLCRHQLAWLFTYAGAVRESCAYLRECMLAAQSLCLPSMVARCLLLYAHLDAECDNQPGARVRLMQVEFIRSHSRIRQQFQRLNSRSPGNQATENCAQTRQTDDADDDVDADAGFLVAGRLSSEDKDSSGGGSDQDLERSPSAMKPSTVSDSDAAGWDLLGEAAREFAWLSSAMEASRAGRRHAEQENSTVKGVETDGLFASLLPIAFSSASSSSLEVGFEGLDIQQSVCDESADRRSPSAAAMPPPPAPPKKRGAAADSTSFSKPAAAVVDEDRRAIGRINKMFMLRQKRINPAAASAAPAAPAAPPRTRRAAAAAASATVAAVSSSIESAPQADFVPQNILRRLEDTAAAGKHHHRVPDPSSSGEAEPVDEAAVAAAIDRLESAYKLLRWLPPPRLFRPLCQQLAVASLHCGRLWEAAHYLCRCLHVSAGHLDRANLRMRSADQILRRVLACDSGPAGLRAALDYLPASWSVLQISYVDSVPGVEPFLLVLRLTPGADQPAICSLRGLGLDFLDEWQSLMRLNSASMRTSDQPQAWWRRRYRLDESASELARSLRCRWLSSPAAKLLDLDSAGEAVLLLDRRLHEFPWEAALSGTLRFSRMPSLSALVGSVAQVRSQLSLQRSYYVLNPDRSLPATEATFAPIFADLGWDGVASRPPEESELLAALKQRDLYVYCGHGSGSKYLSNQSVQQSSVRAAAFLIGCSSGRLHQEGRFEPIGTVHSYIMGGCPAVLAVLWDVTDKDIDRFFNRLLSVWRGVEDGGSELPKLINEARAACKLRCLIGAAPVLFGLPSFPGN
ncbi:hypothetical protein BOX15_Mlig009222g1 [Macrostomum lignano]|uniref:separase n=3 Tax=Macrostomum lignano TaxID=282301 RepID=A0A267EFC6_9PLAT|nr:hypothetical protein BOX15_Mlig009222g1 [Macrostomum lignano]